MTLLLPTAGGISFINSRAYQVYSRTLQGRGGENSKLDQDFSGPLTHGNRAPDLNVPYTSITQRVGSDVVEWKKYRTSRLLNKTQVLVDWCGDEILPSSAPSGNWIACNGFNSWSWTIRFHRHGWCFMFQVSCWFKVHPCGTTQTDLSGFILVLMMTMMMAVKMKMNGTWWHGSNASFRQQLDRRDALQSTFWMCLFCPLTKKKINLDWYNWGNSPFGKVSFVRPKLVGFSQKVVYHCLVWVAHLDFDGQEFAELFLLGFSKQRSQFIIDIWGS